MGRCFNSLPFLLLSPVCFFFPSPHPFCKASVVKSQVKLNAHVASGGWGPMGQGAATTITPQGGRTPTGLPSCNPQSSHKISKKESLKTKKKETKLQFCKTERYKFMVPH